MKTTRRNFILTAASGSLGAFAATVRAVKASVKQAGVIVIPERKVRVLAEADVLVCGGGTAGISAACCAARHGAKVILLERWPSLGGMATNALVNIWHTSDREKQVITGFVQEAVDRGGRFCAAWRITPRGRRRMSSTRPGCASCFYRMTKDAGVRVFWGLTAVESIVEDGRLRAVLVDTQDRPADRVVGLMKKLRDDGEFPQFLEMAARRPRTV